MSYQSDARNSCIDPRGDSDCTTSKLFEGRLRRRGFETQLVERWSGSRDRYRVSLRGVLALRGDFLHQEAKAEENTFNRNAHVTRSK